MKEPVEEFDQLAPIHMVPVVSDLKSTGFSPGRLINFNVTRLKDGIRRIVLSSDLLLYFAFLAD